MAQVEFNYNGTSTVIQCQEVQNMDEIFNNFLSKTHLDKNKINYLYNGKNIPKLKRSLTFNQMANSLDKERKKISVLVIDDEETPDPDKILKRAKNIICPICKGTIKMKINNYKINLYDCHNGHTINNILLNDFEQTQMINLKDIKCYLCNQNKSQSYQNKFYKCYECNIDMCPLCQSKHDKNHSVIDYDKIYYACIKHDEPFTNYCKSCKKNICSLCEKEHLNHEMVLLRDLIFDKKNLLNKLDEIKKSIDIYNENVNKIIELLNNMKNYINTYYNLLENMVNNYNEKERNYELFNNIDEIINNNIIKDINKINNEKEINNIFTNIYNVYNKINSNEIKIIVKIEKEDINKKIYFLDNTNGVISIIKENKNEKGEIDITEEEHHHDYLKELNEKNVELYINDKKYNFEKYFIPEKEGEYHILLKFKVLMTDCSFMFYDCSRLINIDLTLFNTQNVTNMYCMFSGCSNLTNIDLSSFNTENVINMSFMFSECSKLIDANLSSINTQNVSNISGMFGYCYSLTNIDLSSFNTQNVINMSDMFFGCSNLENIDLSSFNAQDSTDVSCMFYECSNLKKIRTNKIFGEKIKNEIATEAIEYCK